MHSINRYAEMRERTSRVGERLLIALPKIPNELELQARWFAGEFGRKFQTLAGESVEIVQFGFWNREAGPDFQDAVVRIGDGPTLRGTIEIDLLDRNWELHGHATNPAFDDVTLHIFLERSGVEFFARTSTHRNVPQIQLDLAALRDVATGIMPLAHAGRCVAPLRNLEAERVTNVLEEAAKFRLRQKANRLRQRIEGHGRDETLFQAVAEALGYKQNRLPFTLLSQRLPLAFLRSRREDAEALLFGVAGFLDAPDLDAQRKSTRGYLRSLWDRWWKYREQFSRLVLPAKLWKTSGARPLNHPHRRLGALATVVAEWKPFSTLARASEATPLISFLADLQHDFWTHHYTLAAPGASSPLALIGIPAPRRFSPMWFTPWQSMTTAKSGMITKSYVPNFPIKRRVSPRRDCSPAIRGNAASSGLWSDNRDYSKFTRIFACAMPPIARAVRCRNNCATGNFAAFASQ